MSPLDNPKDYKDHYTFAPADESMIGDDQPHLTFSIDVLEMMNVVSEEFLQAVRRHSGFAIIQLQHKENGDCIYLGKEGCTIYDRRPQVCRKFDCRAMFLSQTREQRREWIKSGQMSREVYAAARKRLKQEE